MICRFVLHVAVGPQPPSATPNLIPVAKILESGCNLSAGHYNPHGPEEVELREPEEYALEIKELLAQAMKSVDELVAELSNKA